MGDASDGTGEDGAMEDEVELTPEEKMAFQRLPTEAVPPDLLEERIVRALRQDGTLRSVAVGGAREARPAPTGSPRPWTMVGAMAASLVLFGAGIALGHHLGTRSTAEAFLAVREQDAAGLALRIQEAGSAYVSALAELGELRGGAGPDPAGQNVAASHAAQGIEQGRAAALGALYGAAFELARMAPGDADVLRILQILEERRARDLGGEPARNMVWF
jgi:hypothetical protein